MPRLSKIGAAALAAFGWTAGAGGSAELRDGVGRGCVGRYWLGDLPSGVLAHCPSGLGWSPRFRAVYFSGRWQCRAGDGPLGGSMDHHPLWPLQRGLVFGLGPDGDGRALAGGKLVPCASHRHCVPIESCCGTPSGAAVQGGDHRGGRPDDPGCIEEFLHQQHP